MQFSGVSMQLSSVQSLALQESGPEGAKTTQQHALLHMRQTPAQQPR